MPANVHTISNFLNSLLNVSAYQDMALNGLQIESDRLEVTKVALAVDTGLSVIEKAIAEQANMLITHHGLYWGQLQPITGVLAKKIALCLQNGLSIFSSHLPLDGHIQLGNAAQIGVTILNLTNIAPAFEYKGSTLGIVGELESPSTLTQIQAMLSKCEGALAPPHLLAFGKSEIKKIGIATGSASFFIEEASRLELDLYITGESKQEAYHVSKELDCNVIFMGHYASETFGVQALGDVLRSEFGVETVWISEPTGI